jgi:hypothetical protein
VSPDQPVAVPQGGRLVEVLLQLPHLLHHCRPQCLLLHLVRAAVDLEPVTVVCVPLQLLPGRLFLVTVVTVIMKSQSAIHYIEGNGFTSLGQDGFRHQVVANYTTQFFPCP